MKYLNALNKISGVGPQKMKTLMGYFNDSELIWKAGLSDLKNSGLGDVLAERIFFERKNINPDKEWEKIEKEEIKVIDIGNSDYPAPLKEIPNPPYILYVKGNYDLNEKACLAIVGSRKYSAYGAQIAETFAKNLAESGITVISGMAIGIDSFAHRGALSADGNTVAVLGNSLDDLNIYPKINFNLSREICFKGALVSEYPIETQAGLLTFPARNRIIAGMSLGTLVIEAGEKSGALITARMALDYNREVFSIPGSIFSPVSAGTNNLIKGGARMVTGVKDILEELDLSQIKIGGASKEKNAESPEEEEILKTLTSDPIHIDKLAKIVKLPTSAVSGILAIMEIKGWVKNIGGQNYILI